MNKNENLRQVAGAGGGGCFRAGTPVQLEHGKTIPIEQLRVGSEILAFDEKGELHLAKVTKVHYHADPQPVLRVKYWGGSVEITPNHWVLNEYGAFSEIGRLTIHDCLVDGMGHLRPIIDAELVAHESVWNLTVEPHHTFIAGGIRVHNGGHRDLYPTVAGAGGGGSKSSGRAAVEDPDSLQSRVMLAVVDLIGEGQIGGLVSGGQSIFFDGTPMLNADGTSNFQGVTWDVRYGEPNQAPLSNAFGSVETPTAMNVQVKKAMPGVFTISNTNANAVRIAMAMPSLMQQDSDDGDIHGTSVQFRFELSLNSGSYYDATGTLTISGKTRSRYQRAYRLELPKYTSGGQEVTLWTVRVVRITADSATSNLSNDTYIDSYSEIISSALSYPLSAYVGVTIDSAQFSSIPARSYLVDGLFIRVPNNYNAATNTYSGIWDGGFTLAVSANPAWILYDLLTATRYGLGQYITEDMIDEARLYEIGRYCDELVPDGFGGMEPRFRINTAVQSRVEAYQLIMDICGVFNGMAYWTGAQVGFMQDAPSSPTMVFTPANVVDGLFTYTGSSRKDRHSVVNVTWNDPTQSYKQVVEYVEDQELIQKFGIRKAEIIAVGCTTRGQAHRAGKWLLYTERYQSEMISFNVGIDTALVMPGDVVYIHDTQKAGKRVGGRLKGCTATSADLDFPVDLASGSTLFLRMPDGKFAERAILEGGKQSTVTWATPLPQLPVANAIWMISHPSLEPMLARVVSIAQTDDPNTIGVTCLSHNASKYDAIEKDLDLVIPNTSVLDYKTVSAVTNLQVAEAPYQVAPGILGLMLDVSWTGNASTYEIRWRRTGKYETNWTTESANTPNLRMENVRAGDYVFEVTAINSFGVRSPKVVVAYTPEGQAYAPGDVTGFAVVKRTNDLELVWNPVKDIDLLGYEVRVGKSWDSGELVIANFAGTMVAHDQDKAGLYRYHIRSVNRAGAYSDNVTTAEILLEEPATVRGLEIVRHGNGARLELIWEPNKETDLVHYEIREGETWSASTVVAQVKSTSYTTPAGILGQRIFWLKAVTSPGIYSKEASWVSSAVAAPNTTNVILESDQQALDWPGFMVNMERNGAGIVMKQGSSRGEYAMTVDLMESHTCQNSFYVKVGSLVPSTAKWENAAFAWRDNEANKPWQINGDMESITSRKQMARYTGKLSAGQYEGWRLDGTLTSVGGRAPSSTSAQAVFKPVRYGLGLDLNGGTNVEWGALAMPVTFSYQMWIKPTAEAPGVTQSILELTTNNPQERLRLSYNGAGGYFELVNYAGDESVRVHTNGNAISVDDTIFIGIVQTSTKRRLHVAILGRDAVTSHGDFAPIGQIQNLRLFWKEVSVT